MAIRIRYNSPVILTFALAAMLVQVLDATIWRGLTYRWFAVGPHIDFGSVADWWRLFSHVLGHAGWQHLVSNLSLVLLLGPILEERYGSRRMLVMVLAVALATGLANALFFSTGLLGASGVVFMLIALISIVDLRAGVLPLTFVLVTVLFLGGELLDMLRSDDVSQFAHLLGAAVGVAFGFMGRR